MFLLWASCSPIFYLIFFFFLQWNFFAADSKKILNSQETIKHRMHKNGYFGVSIFVLFFFDPMSISLRMKNRWIRHSDMYTHTTTQHEAQDTDTTQIKYIHKSIQEERRHRWTWEALAVATLIEKPDGASHSCRSSLEIELTSRTELEVTCHGDSSETAQGLQQSSYRNPFF